MVGLDPVKILFGMEIRRRDSLRRPEGDLLLALLWYPLDKSSGNNRDISLLVMVPTSPPAAEVGACWWLG